MSQVVSLGSANAERTLEKFRGEIESLHGYQVVELVRTAARISPLQPLNDEQLPVCDGTWVSDLGHRTLYDFVTNAEERGGLGWSWDDWVDEVRAQQIREHFAIHEPDASLVLAQFHDVEAYLGRTPIDAAEYHDTRDLAFKHQFKSQQEAAVLREQELREKAASLMSALTEANESAQANRSELEAMRENLAVVQEEHQLALAAAIEAERRQAHERLMESEEKAEERLMEASRSHEREIAEIREHFSSARYVRREEHEAALETVENRNQVVLELQAKIDALSKQVAELTEERDSLAKLVALKKDELDEALAQVQRLRGQIYDLQQLKQSAGDAGQYFRVGSIERRCEALEGRLQDYQQATHRHREQYGKLMKRYRASQDRCRKALILKGRADKQAAEWKRGYRNLARVFGALLVVLAGIGLVLPFVI